MPHATAREFYRVHVLAAGSMHTVNGTDLIAT